MPGIDYLARVKRGAALLDEVVPDWAHRIDTDTLDISHGMRLLDLDYNGYVEHGFMIRYSDHETEQEIDRIFDLLRDYWYAEITARTEAVSACLPGDQRTP